MATYRQTPCVYYICKGQCKKNRDAEHNWYCQRCNKYVPRAKVKYRNKRKDVLNKIKEREGE